MNITRKYINAFKTGTSFLAGSALKKPLISGMPPAIGVEMTNFCNLRCPECASGSGTMRREKGFMDTAFFVQFIEELKPYLFNINLYFQGEPMMHPDFFAFIDATGHLYKTISTNGHFLDEATAIKLANAGRGRLIISLDGIDNETYSKYRKNGNIEKVITGIKTVGAEFRKRHSKMKLEIQVLLNRYNEHQIDAIHKLSMENGATLVKKSMQVCNPEDIPAWMPESKKYRRYIEENGSYRIKSYFPRRCARLWFNPVVTWDGKVLPCCFDKDADYIMGDLREQSFREIWHGRRYLEFRRAVLSGREKIPICRNCTSGLYL